MQVLYLGRVSDSKGTFDLLDAWAAAFDDGTLARLTIAGDGELERARQRIAELGIEASVDLLGVGARPGRPGPPRTVPGARVALAQRGPADGRSWKRWRMGCAWWRPTRAASRT